MIIIIILINITIIIIVIVIVIIIVIIIIIIITITIIKIFHSIKKLKLSFTHVNTSPPHPAMAVNILGPRSLAGLIA